MIEFDNENQDYLYRMGKKLLRGLELTYPKYSREKNRILEETLDRMNARQLKPRLTQDELDEVLRALGVYIPKREEQQEPGNGWVKVKEFAKENKYDYRAFLERIRKVGIERRRYKRVIYARREDLERFVFGRTGVNIQDYITFSEFFKKYKIGRIKAHNKIKGKDWGDSILRGKGNRIYIKKEAIERILDWIMREDRSTRAEKERQEKEGWYARCKVAEALTLDESTTKKLLMRWEIEERRILDRFCFYNIDEIIEKIKNLKKWKSKAEKKVLMKKKEIIENLKKLKNKSGEMITDKITDK
jgi:hypothetical protein